MDEFEKYYATALRFLGYRSRSEKEIRDNLTKKKAPSEVVETVISKLKAQKFVNDEKFAKAWIESRLRFKPRAIRLIKIELKQKGIDSEIIEKVLGNTETKIVSEVESAKKLVEKKIEKYKELPRQEIYQKLGGFLARRGFDWDTIKESIDDILKKGV